MLDVEKHILQELRIPLRLSKLSSSNNPNGEQDLALELGQRLLPVLKSLIRRRLHHTFDLKQNQAPPSGERFSQCVMVRK